jgi:DMSO/TMAO reductase YedYZ molybdopterin-dependent catalytic subunit
MTYLIRPRIALFLLMFTSGIRLAAAQDSCAGGFSPSFRLSGQVANPKTYNLQELRQLPRIEVHDVFFAGSSVDEGTFTGVLLWDLIEAAEVIIDPDQRNDLLRKYVLITGSDCYETVYSLGELAPRIGGSHPVIVAFKRDGVLLGPDTGGMARIINPGDKFGARRVFNIAHIRVLGRPAPQ